MKVRYLVLGNGFFGNKLANYLEGSFLSKARINSVRDVESEIQKFDPKFVINCVGKTGRPNVDWCEDHKLETAQSNITVPLHILEACQKLNKKMVHLSTGCIYEGDNGGKGFSEEDEPNFYGSYYSRTKLIIEKILKEYDNVLQLRLRMPMDDIPGERNILDKLLKYNKVANLRNSITVLGDFLPIAKRLMDSDEMGIFNTTNKGAITNKEILDIYEEVTGEKKNYELIDQKELEKFTKARRSVCVISVKKLEDKGIKIRDVKEAVRDCIQRYSQNKLRL
ncbi:MAG: sugar nucleotide-binding protein [Nanoarchaeota archaeon]